MKRSGTILRGAAAVFAVIVLSPLAAQPQDAGAAPRSEDIVKALVPTQIGVTTKSLKGISVVPAENALPPSIDLTVNFAFDSTELNNDTLLTIERLATALNDPRLKGYSFTIAGHTDAKGTEEYNQRLSEGRASAVRARLIAQYGVDPTRLTAIGYGKTQLVDTADPYSEKNRRVQVVNIGPLTAAKPN